MSTNVLGQQFIARRVAQLKEEGRSLVRPTPPPPGSLEASMAAHPAGKQLHAVQGDDDEAARAARREEARRDAKRMLGTSEDRQQAYLESQRRRLRVVK